MSFELPPRYRILGELRRNEWETLLGARDLDLDCDVLIQIPGPGALARLRRTATRDLALREARGLARIQHRAVSRLRNVIETPEGPVLVLDPIVGTPLSDRLDDGQRLPPDELLKLALGLCDALSAVHEAGIVHRNLALANILIQPDGQPVLTGFVFAKPWNPGGFSSIHYPIGGRSDATAAEVSALPIYYAPEQVAGRAADARSDLFGLGSVLYRCLTGAEAYPGGPGRQPTEPPFPPAPLPAELSGVILRCLAWNSAERFQTAGELRTALLGLKATVVSTGAAPHGAPPKTPGLSGERWLAIVAGTAAVLLVVVVSVILRPGGRGEGPADRGRLIPSTPTSLNATYEHSFALLIGIGPAYGRTSFRPLQNAERDVEVLSRTLNAMPWEQWNITEIIGPEATFDMIRGAMADIENKAGPNDRVFIYYAGHGERHPLADQGWIIPADAVGLDADPSRKNWFLFDDFNKFIERCSAKHVLVALDCCFSGLGVSTDRGGGSETRKFNDAFLTRKAHLLLASSRPNQAAWDGPQGGHSPFATAFLKALQSGEPLPLTTNELVYRVQQAFMEEGVAHQPMLGRFKEADNTSEFVFFRSPGRSAADSIP